MRNYSLIVVLSALLQFAVGHEYVELRPGREKFPPGFKFGAATASHQIEGAWNVSDKSQSIWDVFAHTKPGAIKDGATADMACDSYHLWKRDIDIASELGLHFYRFSISWPRLLPTGFPNHISEDGKRYYNNLIDGLIGKGIEPVVTIYHWELPQSLQELGGWTNPLVVDWFAEYARVVFHLFGDRVKTWITLNEPLVFCEGTYSTGLLAPGLYSPGIGNYLCNKYSLLAHAKAWRIYDNEFRHKYHGKVALTNMAIWFEPEDGVHEEVAELARQLGIGIYSHPIYSKKGGWPHSIEKIIAHRSRAEGYLSSRLPSFTEAEIKMIQGTYDFYGFNYYTARTTRQAKQGEDLGIWPQTGSSELNILLTVNPEWKRTSLPWFYIYPEGMRRHLKWLKDEYGDIEIYIVENGYANTDPKLHDEDRVEFYKNHLKQVLLSIYEDGVNVTRFAAWSMIDNYEWIDGYQSKFGLYAVDFSDPKRKRTPRSSAYYYANVIRNHSLIISRSFSPYTRSSSNNLNPKISCLVMILSYLLLYSYF